MTVEAKSTRVPRQTVQPGTAIDHENHKFAPVMQGSSAPFDMRFADLYHRTIAKGEKPINLDFAWAMAIAHSPELLEEFRAHRREYKGAMGDILQMVGVTHPSQIVAALNDEQTATRRRVVANRAIGRLYGADETGKRVVKENRRARTVAEYAKSANDYMESLRFGVLNPVAWKFRPSEEVLARDHPLDLVELIFVPGYDPKLGFEALRKLFLMTKIAAIDYRSTELAEGGTYQMFTDLLDERFWAQDQLKGQVTPVVLLSVHSPEDYSLMDAERLKKLNPKLMPLTEVPEDEVAAVTKQVREHDPDRKGYHLRLTNLPSRTFVQEGHDVHAFIDKRLKPFHSRVTKMLRKGEEDPSTAVEDKIGMMVVVRDRRSVDRFLDHLQETGILSGSVLRMEGIEDTLDGQRYSARNVGSSPDIRMLKFYARVHGARIEVIVHTYEAYLEYNLHDKKGHPEKEVRDLIDTGVYELLCPPSIYPKINPGEDRTELLSIIHLEKRANRIG